MALAMMNSTTRMASAEGSARSATSAPRPRRAPAIRGPILQRKCACGGAASGLSGSCDDCGKKKLGLQTFALGKPGDGYEREADHAADQAMRGDKRSGQGPLARRAGVPGGGASRWPSRRRSRERSAHPGRAGARIGLGAPRPDGAPVRPLLCRCPHPRRWSGWGIGAGRRGARLYPGARHRLRRRGIPAGHEGRPLAAGP